MIGISRNRLLDTRRYILSTLPVLYISMLRDSEGTNQFLSDDGHGHVCTVTGAVQGIQGKILDGIDDKMVVPDHNTLDVTSGTLIVWFKDTGNTAIYRELIEKNRSASGNDDPYLLRVEITSGNLIGRVGDGITNVYIDSFVNVADSAWHFAALSWQASDSISLRVDSTVVSDVITFTPLTTTADLWVGDGANGIFSGTIGAVILYPKCFSQTIISRIQDATQWRYR